MNGKIPVISTGGGIFFSGYGKRNVISIIRQIVRDSIGIDIKLIVCCVVPIEGTNNVVDFDSEIHNIDGYYKGAQGNVEQVVIDRVNRGEWQCPIKPKALSSKQQSLEEGKRCQIIKTNIDRAISGFAKQMASRSSKNSKFALKLLLNSDQALIISQVSIDEGRASDNIKRNFEKIVIIEPKLTVDELEGSFQQHRILTKYELPVVGLKYGHITVAYDYDKGIKYSEMKKSEKYLGSTRTETLVTLLSDKKKCQLILIDGMGDLLEGAHITVNSGKHYPAEMKSAAIQLRTAIPEPIEPTKIAFEEKETRVTLKDKNKKDIEYKVENIEKVDVSFEKVFLI